MGRGNAGEAAMFRNRIAVFQDIPAYRADR
jgi:hypothetical protein